MELDMQKIEQWKNGLERDGFLVIGKHCRGLNVFPNMYYKS